MLRAILVADFKHLEQLVCRLGLVRNMHTHMHTVIDRTENGTNQHHLFDATVHRDF